MAVIKITLLLVFGGIFGLALATEVPTYLWAKISIPQEAIAALPERAQTAGIPLAVAGGAGRLEFVRTETEEDLLSSNAYLYLDGPFFFLGVSDTNGAAFLRGEQTEAEIICFGNPEALSHMVSLLDSPGLLSPGTEVEFTERPLSLKIPAPPEGVKLDPVLWGLLLHPDWFAFACDYGIERVGLRVRVVAEVEGTLPEKYEPYIQSSSNGLVSLLVPIPLLDDLGKEAVVRLVRPPYKPHPLAPANP